MPAIGNDYYQMLTRELDAHYVPLLPPLTQNRMPAADQTRKQQSRAFGAFSLVHHLGIPIQTAVQSVIDDFNDNGIDAIYFHPQNETLYLVQGKIKHSEQFAQDEALSFCNGCRLLLNQDLQSFNEHFARRIADIQRYLSDCSHICLIVAYCGDGVSQTAQNALDGLIHDRTLDERLVGPVEFFTPQDVEAALRSTQEYEPVEAEIVLENYGRVEDPRKTYYGVVDLRRLAELHREHGKALYEQNLRYFLGTSKSSVNAGIQQTLRENPLNFFYLNNGVTALCSEIRPRGGTPERRVFKVTGLSVINGAQTVASAAELLNATDGPDIDSAKVLLTLIETRPEEALAPQITRARNHQNPVSLAHFAALDPTQERIRQELACFGIFYHYRSEIEQPPDNLNLRISEALQALALLEPDPRFPVWLKASSALMSDPSGQYYQGIFHAGVRGVHLANAVYCFRQILALARAADRGSTGVDRLVYRHGSYMLASVLLKRLRARIQSPQPINPGDIPHLISQPFDELRQQALDLFTRTITGVGPLSCFKSQERSVPYLCDLALANYRLESHEAVLAIRSQQDDGPFPQARMFRFLSRKAPQI